MNGANGGQASKGDFMPQSNASGCPRTRDPVVGRVLASPRVSQFRQGHFFTTSPGFFQTPKPLRITQRRSPSVPRQAKSNLVKFLHYPRPVRTAHLRSGILSLEAICNLARSGG